MLHRGHLVCIKSALLKWNRTRDKRWERIQRNREFRSHTTSIQSWDCFKADTSQLIYLRGHFSSEESLTAGEEHARYTLADGHPLALKRNLNEFLQYQFYRLRTRNGIQLSNIASVIWRESVDLDGDNERCTEGIVPKPRMRNFHGHLCGKLFSLLNLLEMKTHWQLWRAEREREVCSYLLAQ